MTGLNRLSLKLEDFLVAQAVPQSNSWWFATGVYGLLTAKLLLLWPKIDQFYDVAHRTTSLVASNPLHWLSKTTLFVAVSNLNLMMLLLLGIVGIGLVYRNATTALLIFFLSLNYNTLVAKAINGSDYLLTFFCLILIFSQHSKTPGLNRILVANAAWLLLKVNFCYLYFVNAYGKLIKKIWLNGDAIYQTWNLDYFANPHLIPSFFYHKTFCMIAGWAVIAFEFAFAFLIWFNGPKKILLIIGVLFHLGIGLLLSLPDFALTMIIGYIPFLKPTWLNNKKAAQPLEPL